jgi:hypothetical protein
LLTFYASIVKHKNLNFDLGKRIEKFTTGFSEKKQFNYVRENKYMRLSKVLGIRPQLCHGVKVQDNKEATM